MSDIEITKEVNKAGFNIGDYVSWNGSSRGTVVGYYDQDLILVHVPELNRLPYRSANQIHSSFNSMLNSDCILAADPARCKKLNSNSDVQAVSVDEKIVSSLAALGLEVGQICRWKNPASKTALDTKFCNLEMVVVGYDDLNQLPVMRFLHHTETIGKESLIYQSNNDNVHSRYKYSSRRSFHLGRILFNTLTELKASVPTKPPPACKVPPSWEELDKFAKSIGITMQVSPKPTVQPKRSDFLYAAGRIADERAGTDQPNASKVLLKKPNPIKADLKKAGYRIVAKQAVRVTHGTLIFAVRKAGASNENVKSLVTLLSTEYGKAAVSILLGLGLAHSRKLRRENKDDLFMDNIDIHMNILAKEFRVAGMTTAANELVETIFQAAFEAMTAEPAKIRVVSEETSLLEQALEEEMVQDEPKKSRAI